MRGTTRVALSVLLLVALTLTLPACGGSSSRGVGALPPGGSPLAWGDNWTGHLGDGTTTDSPVPVRVVDGAGGFLAGVTAISAGDVHTVALMKDGTVWAWGENFVGQLGDGSTIDTSVPVQAVDGAGGFLTGVIAISAGGDHTVALMGNGTVRAWGGNFYGQLGNGSTTGSPVPAQVANGAGGFLTGATGISAGGRYTVALMGNGNLVTWGRNSYGQLGDGTNLDRLVPVQVVDGVGGFLTRVTGISAGAAHTVSLMVDGTVRGWGANFVGQLGDGTTVDRSVPVQVVDGAGGFLGGVTAVAAAYGEGHVYCGRLITGSSTVALMGDGTVRAWGWNLLGQLGDGTTDNSIVPVEVVDGAGGSLTGVTAISAGAGHTVALMGDGTVRAWGQNFVGSLGDGNIGCSIQSSVPVQLVDGAGGFLSDVWAIDAGGTHSLALRP